MDIKIIELAAKVMKVSVEEAAKHNKLLPDINAFYFWNPVRGGISVIINSSGEKLGAGSSVNFEKHLKAFLDGKRN